MLIWIQRIFAQHDHLRKAWESATAEMAKTQADVIPAKRRVDELRESIEELEGEQKRANAQSRRQLLQSVASPLLASRPVSAGVRARPVRTHVITV